MQVEQFVPWDEDYEELIFPCHTSVISKELLNSKLVELGIIDDSMIKQGPAEEKSEAEKPKEGQKLSKYEQMLQQRRTFRSMVLH